MDMKQVRYLNVLLGIWLLISSFVWRHDGAQFTNTWIMGIVTIVVALVAVGAPAFRYVNTAAGLWVLISAFALPTMSLATRWNNAIVGIVICLLSLVGPEVPTTTRPRAA